MRYTILFESRAKRELEDAYTYYNKQQPDLGTRFVAEIEKKIAVIQSNPLLSRAIEGSIRQISLHRFPFVLIYEPIGTEIIVYAVFHTKRSPQNKLKRKKE